MSEVTHNAALDRAQIHKGLVVEGAFESPDAQSVFVWRTMGERTVFSKTFLTVKGIVSKQHCCRSGYQMTIDHFTLRFFQPVHGAG